MNAFNDHSKKHFMPTNVEVDVQSVSSTSLPHGKVQVTLVIVCNAADNIPAQIEEGDKLNIEVPSHHPPA